MAWKSGIGLTRCQSENIAANPEKRYVRAKSIPK